MKYEYGEVVLVGSTALNGYRPGQVASVCGFIRDQKTSVNVYLVEFGDGIAIEIPEEFLGPWVKRDKVGL